MNRSNLFQASIAILILLAIGLLFGGLPFLRASAGLLFVLLLPGMAITAALFPGREFGFPERLALATGYSIAVAILSGVALHLTPWGLQTGVWVSVLAGITAVAGLAAWGRRARSRPPVEAIRTAGLPLVQTSLIGLAVLLAVLSIFIARQPTPAAGFEGYTSLWIHPVQTEEGYAVQLGVSSMEFEPVTYRLELQQDGQLIGEYPEITLSPGESTQVVAQLNPEQASEGPVEALLFRSDLPRVAYRQVAWWPGDPLE